ncbi:MAG TPA: YceI family protein, partial [Candidatus Saccharimonadales bacterium]|nr:YceI family protein [Candidatus Saccharimonadales bacterium]
MNRIGRWTSPLALSLAALAACAAAQAAPVEYRIDPAHSEVGFAIRHMFSKVNGHFGKFSGIFTYDAENPAASSGKLEIDPASITTAVERRDNHLRSPDFFDVAK